jgi:hypothetical protein
VTRTERYVAQFVESFPTPMQPGVLYISTVYATAGHQCPCGCRRDVVTKLSPARWRIIFDGEVSLWPSIAATGLACNSHYFITRGDVDWRQKLTPTEAVRANETDRRATAAQRSTNDHLLKSLWRRLKLRR